MEEVKWTDLTIEVLRAECKRQGLPVSGPKDDVVGALCVATGRDTATLNPQSQDDGSAAKVGKSLSFMMETLSVQQAVLSKLLEHNLTRPGPDESFDPLDDNSDADAYFSFFERISLVGGWSEVTKLSKLVPRLRGKARTVFLALSDEEARCYSSVKDAILKRFCGTNESYRQKFRSLEKLHSQTYYEFAYTLRELLIKWLAPSSSLSTSTDFTGILDCMALEQFYTRVPTYLRTWLMDKQNNSLYAVASMADEYVAARQYMVSVPTSSFGRSQTSNTGWRPPNPDAKPTRFANARAPDGRVICNFCQLPGHISRVCPSKESVEANVRQLVEEEDSENCDQQQ